jgi:hypothetical protein
MHINTGILSALLRVLVPTLMSTSPRSGVACYSRDSLVTFSSSRVSAARVGPSTVCRIPNEPLTYMFLARPPLALPQFDMVRTKIFLVWKGDAKAATDDLLHLILYAR